MAFPFFGVTPPWYPDDFDAFNLYAIDCEEHSEKIKRFIDLLSMQENPNDPLIQNYLFEYVGLNSDTLMQNEIEYIEREVSKR